MTYFDEISNSLCPSLQLSLRVGISSYSRGVDPIAFVADNKTVELL